MFMRPSFRLVPDNTKIQFMRGRIMGLVVSAILSTASVVLFFYPGLNLGIDFSGGIVMEVRTPGPADFAQIRAALAAEHIPQQGVQQFGDASEVLIRLGAQPTEAAVQQAVTRVRTALEKAVPGVKVLRTDAVGASVSAELFRNGLLALGISLVMILVYIWFRFEWQFAVGAVVTLILDITKAIGFLALTRIEFDLVMVAAILTILGYSTNDKVVVYDRVRENLRKYKTLPLRDLIDLSINETLNRTLGTSMTVFLASLPLALFGGESISGFAWVMLFGIVVGTSSSIFIAAPILLFLGENRLRREAAPAAGAGGALVIRRRILLAGTGALALAAPAHATETITLLVGAKAGSPVDALARAFVPFLARHLPASAIAISNVDGGAGLAALQALAQAEPTGATLGWVATPTLPARMVDRGADDLLRRIGLLGAVEKEPIAIVSPAATPLGSVQDIIARAAEDAEAVPLGTPPPGSPPHLAALRLQALAGTRLNIVAFPSAAAARQAAVAGNVAAAALGLSSAIGDLREGRLVGLGIAAANRADAFPDMPPLRDSGLDLSAVIRRGLAAPAGLPEPVAATPCRALEAVVEDLEFHDHADTNGFVAAWRDGASWTAEAQDERAELAKLWATEPWLQEGAEQP